MAKTIKIYELPDGQKLTMAQAADKKGIPRSKFQGKVYRLSKKMPIEQAMLQALLDNTINRNQQFSINQKKAIIKIWLNGNAALYDPNLHEQDWRDMLACLCEYCIGSEIYKMCGFSRGGIINHLKKFGLRPVERKTRSLLKFHFTLANGEQGSIYHFADKLRVKAETLLAYISSNRREDTPAEDNRVMFDLLLKRIDNVKKKPEIGAESVLPWHEPPKDKKRRLEWLERRYRMNRKIKEAVAMEV